MKKSARVIASANGLEATRLAYQLIQSGHDPLHAVVEGVTLVEDDPRDMTVGYGGLPNEDGIVELDAAAMHGPSHRAGAVAGLRNVRHAARLARLVLEQTKHVLLVGQGANDFAKAQGFPEEDLLTDQARKIWLYWKQTNSPRQDWVPPPVESLDPAVIEFFRLFDKEGASATAGYRRSETFERPTGTIHCSGINAARDISCVTTTSGLAFKLPGRVGDTPIPGAGLYVDNEVGSCGSTGRGEENLRNCSSHAAVELMRQGLSPAEAGRQVLERVVANAREPWLKGKDGLPNFGLKLYVLKKSGEYAGVSLWGPTQFAVTDDAGTRLEPCHYLFEKP
ncbi:N(4)-(beta-N-acetylglucosaminyl)-L-asparaginase [Planctomicrobium sp. SH661]|uniref:N(4)-(beta-N-acetylglucosaminyl)-L-asparaginase n=1 Tax=Planctomicrobium sp. SH661 TaxID=3448124 RepID=UPI003F5BB168